MKKQILNLGKALNKAEQKSINGGREDGPCQSMIGGMIYWGQSVAEAQSYYNQGVAAGVEAKYCCASCNDRDWAIQ